MKIIAVHAKNFSGKNFPDFTNSNLMLGLIVFNAVLNCLCKRAEKHIDGAYGEAN